jgi:P22 coat protein - gene protein 5
MSLNSFIPQIWSDTILAALRMQLVFGNLFNTDYEGELKQMGDTVRINAIGDVTVYNYTKDTDINAPQSMTDAQTMLTISNAKYYNVAIDDVDRAQAHPDAYAEMISWAGYKLALTMDQFYAGFYTDAVNLIGSSGSFQTVSAPTAANAGAGTTFYDYLVVMGQHLTENAVPEDNGRWCVVPPWGKTLLMQDVRFTSFNTDAGRQAILSGKLDASGGNAAEGYIGMIDGMSVYKSLNAPHLGGSVGVAGSQDVILAGHKMAVTKAEGLNETEAYRPPYRFSDAVKSLVLYGAKTVRPYALCAAYLQHP